MSRQVITFNTLEVHVEYIYIPGESQERYSGNLDGYPGSTPKVDISSVYLRVNKNYTVSLTSFFEETGLIYKLEDQLLKEIEEEND